MLLTWSQIPETFLPQNPESENLYICLQFCSVFFTGYWVCVQGYLSTCRKWYPQNWKNQSEIHVVLSLFAAVYGSVDCLLKSLCLTNLGNCQIEFCLSPESAHCYALYSCLCLVNAFEIIPIQVQDWTRGEDIVQTYNKWWIKHLKIPKTVFSPSQHVIPCAFFFIFSEDFVPISLQIEGYKCFYVFLPRKIFGN